MDSLYKVDKIVGKGFGWIALQDIKAGIVICKEKPQFIPEEHLGTGAGERFIADHFATLMKSFFAMSKMDQKEFLELYSTFLDPNSMNDGLKEKWTNDIFIQNRVGQNHLKDCEFDSNLLMKIICIHLTNRYGCGETGVIGINTSRINHSCCPNSVRSALGSMEEGEIEIRTISKILEGQEITIGNKEAQKM